MIKGRPKSERDSGSCDSEHLQPLIWTVMMIVRRSHKMYGLNMGAIHLFNVCRVNNSPQVTRRLETNEGDWSDWNWRTDGDIMVNGAFFVPSGAGMSTQYARASSTEPKSVAIIDRLTSNAGVFGDPR